MRRLVGFIAVVAFAVIYLSALKQSDVEARTLPKAVEGGGASFAPFVKVLALEFDGLAADMVFIEGLVFFGETLERETIPRMQEWEWQWLFETFKASAEIDPYFYDPYYIANAIFPWEGRLVRETNDLLVKGADKRDWDWTLLFYAGFNEFFFLHNSDTAADLLMQAARRPDSSPIIPTLAARLAYKGSRTENAIRFLVELLQGTTNPAEREQYETRLEALKGIYVLEQTIKKFKVEFGRVPLRLQELVESGLIDAIPDDPYGGTFYIALNGSVGTTSDLRPIQ